MVSPKRPNDCPTIEYSQDKASSWWTDRLLYIIIGLFLATALIPAAFWGIWYLISGSIPHFLGFSRFWLDVIAMPFYCACIFAVFNIELDQHECLTDDGKYDVSLGEFVSESPLESGLIVFAVVNFAASLLCSLSFGLAAYIALLVFILLCLLVWRIICYLRFGFVSAIQQAGGFEDKDDD